MEASALRRENTTWRNAVAGARPGSACTSMVPPVLPGPHPRSGRVIAGDERESAAQKARARVHACRERRTHRESMASTDATRTGGSNSPAAPLGGPAPRHGIGLRRRIRFRRRCPWGTTRTRPSFARGLRASASASRFGVARSGSSQYSSVLLCHGSRAGYQRMRRAGKRMPTVRPLAARRPFRQRSRKRAKRLDWASTPSGAARRSVRARRDDLRGEYPSVRFPRRYRVRMAPASGWVGISSHGTWAGW